MSVLDHTKSPVSAVTSTLINVSYSLFLVHTVPVFFVVYVLGPGWFTSNGLGAALIGATVALVAALFLAGGLFLVAERPYFATQRRKHS